MTDMTKGVLLVALVGFGIWGYSALRHGKGGCCSKKYTFATIQADDLKKKMDEQSVVVVNVLAKDYYDDCHIQGSINVPLAELATVSQSWKKDQPVVVYCAHCGCHASAQAAEQLMKAGFTTVAAYEGGTKEWLEKGFAVEGPCNADYLKTK